MEWHLHALYLCLLVLNTFVVNNQMKRLKSLNKMSHNSISELVLTEMLTVCLNIPPSIFYVTLYIVKSCQF